MDFHVKMLSLRGSHKLKKIIHVYENTKYRLERVLEPHAHVSQIKKIIDHVSRLRLKNTPWYGMVWYGKTLFNDAGPDDNLLISTGGRQNVNYLQEKKKYFYCEYFWCDHIYHLAIISSNNILKLVDRFRYLCVKREAIPQFSPTIIETLFEELSFWFRKG